MIHDKGRLNQVFLNILFKKQTQNIPLLMPVLEFDSLFLCQGLCFLCSLNLIKIYICILFQSIYHCDSFKRLAQIHCDSTIFDCSSSQHFLRYIAVQVLCQVHHTVIICICLVQLHQRKFGVMSCVQSLIAEYTANLVYTLHAAYDQPLQVKLQRNAEFKVFI